VRAFLFLNGWVYEPDQAEEVATIEGAAAGTVAEEAFARWIAANTNQGPP